MTKFLSNSRWVNGPEFLCKSKDEWLKETPHHRNEDMQLKLKKPKRIIASTIKMESDDLLERLLLRASSWMKLKRIVASIMLWKTKEQTIEMRHLQDAETKVLQLLQHFCFTEEIADLRNKRNLKKSSCLRNLDVFVDENDILRVGGKIGKSNLYEKEIVILLDVLFLFYTNWTYQNSKSLSNTSSTLILTSKRTHL